MKLTLIYPNIGCTAAGRYIDEGRMEPLTLGVIPLFRRETFKKHGMRLGLHEGGSP